MEMIEIDKIIIKENIRKDYGDLTELTASIKENGIRNPLEINKDNELVDGHRRLKAAAAAGMKKVPYFYTIGEIDRTTSQLIAGIFPKNLNPIEEGEAFSRYMDENKISEETLAKKIGKNIEYIKRRLNLLAASPDVKKAIVDKKIQIGHAAVLSRFDSKQQAKFLKEIISEDIHVKDINQVLNSYDGEGRATVDLDDAPFNKKGCKDCMYNGGEQMFLTEVGDCLKGRCLNPACYVKKVNEWLQAEKAVLEKKGIKIMEQKELEAIPGAHEIYTYDYRYKAAVKDLARKPDTFVVTFRKNSYNFSYEKQIWCIKAKANKNNISKTLNLSGKEDLKQDTKEYMVKLKIKACREKMNLSVSRMIVLAEAKQSIILKMQQEVLQGLFRSKNTDKDTIDIAKEIINDYGDESLDIISTHLKVDAVKLFKMDKEFLELHTKEQMLKLAKELKIDLGDAQKNPEIITAIIKGWKPGQVPKSLRQ